MTAGPVRHAQRGIGDVCTAVDVRDDLRNDSFGDRVIDLAERRRAANEET